MDFFPGDYTSALRGCCALKFLHALEIHQGLLAHTQIGGPPKQFNRENLKFGLKFNNFRASGSILKKLFQATCRETGVITCVQFLEGPPPKICYSKNNVQNSARLLTTFDFDRKYLRNGSTYL